MFVAHAAPATPMPSPKMKSGSSSRFTPNPTTMHIMEGTTAPSLRIAAENPNARWANTCEKTTVRTYVFAISNAAGVTPAPPVQRRIGSTNTNTSGGSAHRNSSLNATSSPRSFSQAIRSPSPSLIDMTAACPAPTNTPNAPNTIIRGKASVRAAIASWPHPCPIQMRSTTA